MPLLADERHLPCPGVEPQGVEEGLVLLGQLEEDLIGELLVLVMGRLERLQEVEVEVPRRLCGGPLVGGAEEEIAPAGDLVFPPLDLMFPDLVAPDVGLVGTLQDTGQGVEVVLVELRVGERVGLVLDLGVVVDGLLKVEVILVVVRVVRDELTAIVFVISLRQDSTVVRRKSLVRSGSIVLNRNRPSLQFFGGRSDLGTDVIGREAMDRQAVDDPQGHRLQRRAGVRLLNPVLDHLAHVDHFPDLGNRPQGGVRLQHVPVGVVADQPRLIGRDILVEQPLHLGAQGLQHLPFLGDRDGLEDLQVSWDGPGKGERTLRGVRPCRRRVA